MAITKITRDALNDRHPSRQGSRRITRHHRSPGEQRHRVKCWSSTMRTVALASAGGESQDQH